MNFEEKLCIADMESCSENFYKSLEWAMKVENDSLCATEENRDEAEFLFRFTRAGMVKIFEMTLENAWKVMQRWVKINVDNKIHEKPKRELFRTAHQCGLITDPVIWWSFYESRNKSVHIYKEEIAKEVYDMAKSFYEHLELFMERLKERI
jgi:nucleotidyltransferase substrate binding protein (TIGR01987 family)